MKQKKIILIIGAAILLLAFRKPKKKGSIEVGPLVGNNMYAKHNSILFDSPYAGMILYNFKGGELLNFITEDVDDYFVSFVKPGGKLVKGYISKTDVNIQ